MTCKDEKYVEDGNFVLNTEEEVGHTKKYNVGDYVVIVNEKDYHNFKKGDVCKVVDCSCIDEDYYLELIYDDTEQIINQEDFKKITIEEAKWAKLGREPYELKKGDIVKVLKDNSAGSKLYRDEIGEVNKINPEVIQIKGRINSVNWVNKEDVELLCPAENRVG